MFGYNDRSTCDCMNYSMFSFYDDFNGKDEKVDSSPDSLRSMIVMTLKEGVKYSGVPEKEIQRLIDKNKISYFKSNIGMLVWYQDMKNIKYWWKVYKEET